MRWAFLGDSGGEVSGEKVSGARVVLSCLDCQMVGEWKIGSVWAGGSLHVDLCATKGWMAGEGTRGFFVCYHPCLSSS